MNRSLKIVLIVVASLFGAAILISSGLSLGQIFLKRNNFRPLVTSPNFGPSMMRRVFLGFDEDNIFNSSNCISNSQGPALEGNTCKNNALYPMGSGMMGRRFALTVNPGNSLSIEQAREVFQDYLSSLDYDDLYIHEIMVFDQNAYAVIGEESTGFGAMELLADHRIGRVFPEYGPNHMWNLKYGMMRIGNRGCGMRFLAGFSATTQVSIEDFDPATMDVSSEEAIELAQDYLDKTQSGALIAKEGTAFYGYYTLDYLVDNKIAGMLSVNGFTGDIWLHTWHGQFLEEWEYEETE